MLFSLYRSRSEQIFSLANQIGHGNNALLSTLLSLLSQFPCCLANHAWNKWLLYCLRSFCLQQQYICIHYCLLCILEGREDDISPYQGQDNEAFDGKLIFELRAMVRFVFERG